jgi:membrane protease subunit HflK
MSTPNQPPPWGKKKGPPTPEELIAALLKKIKDSFEGGGSSGQQGGEPGDMPSGMGSILGKVVTVIGVLVLLNILSSSFYTIEPGERGVILRLGKIRGITNPGLNFKAPLLDTLIKVDVETVRKQEFGFRTKIPGQKTIYEKEGFEAESLILTGDKNVIDVEWIVQYKVHDPLLYLFKVKDTEQAVRDVSEKSIRRVMGNQDFDYALQNREIIEQSMSQDLQNTLDMYESGIKIVTVKLQDVNPPEAVKPAFNEVNEADQDMKRLVNEAEENYNRVIPKAKGSAKQILEEAHGYAVERVNLAKGEAGRFLNILHEFSGSKEVTRRRMYLETMQKVLPKVDSIYLIDKEQRAIMPFLDLGKAAVPAPAKIDTPQ